jgi:hypothetical protein
MSSLDCVVWAHTTTAYGNRENYELGDENKIPNYKPRDADINLPKPLVKPEVERISPTFGYRSV